VSRHPAGRAVEGAAESPACGNGFAEGGEVDEADEGFLSPYGTSTTKRVGSFHLDGKKTPEPWLRESQVRQAAKQARAASDKMKDNTTPTKGKRGKK